jgi:hypothetical protein
VPQAPDLGIILHVAWRLKPVNTRLMVLETRMRRNRIDRYAAMRDQSWNE